MTAGLAWEETAARFDPNQRRGRDGKWARGPGGPSSEGRGLPGPWSQLGETVTYHGNLGIDRSKMPQLSGVGADGEYHSSKEMVPKFQSYLRSQGITVRRTRISPEKLKPTQTTGDAPAIGRIADTLQSGELEDTKPITVSADGHVLDGHHNWAGRLLAGRRGGRPGLPRNMRVVQVGLTMPELIEQARRFGEIHGIGARKAGEFANPKHIRRGLRWDGPELSLVVSYPAVPYPADAHQITDRFGNRYQVVYQAGQVVVTGVHGTRSAPAASAADVDGVARELADQLGADHVTPPTPPSVRAEELARAGHWKHEWIPLDFAAAQQKFHHRVPSGWQAGDVRKRPASGASAPGLDELRSARDKAKAEYQQAANTVSWKHITAKGTEGPAAKTMLEKKRAWHAAEARYDQAAAQGKLPGAVNESGRPSRPVEVPARTKAHPAATVHPAERFSHYGEPKNPRTGHLVDEARQAAEAGKQDKALRLLEQADGLEAHEGVDAGSGSRAVIEHARMAVIREKAGKSNAVAMNERMALAHSQRVAFHEATGVSPNVIDPATSPVTDWHAMTQAKSELLAGNHAEADRLLAAEVERLKAARKTGIAARVEKQRQKIAAGVAGRKTGLPPPLTVTGRRAGGGTVTAVDHRGNHYTVSYRDGLVTVTDEAGKSLSAPAPSSDEATAVARRLAGKLPGADAKAAKTAAAKQARERARATQKMEAASAAADAAEAAERRVHDEYIAALKAATGPGGAYDPRSPAAQAAEELRLRFLEAQRAAQKARMARLVAYDKWIASGAEAAQHAQRAGKFNPADHPRVLHGEHGGEFAKAGGGLPVPKAEAAAPPKYTPNAEIPTVGQVDLNPWQPGTPAFRNMHQTMLKASGIVADMLNTDDMDWTGLVTVRPKAVMEGTLGAHEWDGSYTLRDDVAGELDLAAVGDDRASVQADAIAVVLHETIHAAGETSTPHRIEAEGREPLILTESQIAYMGEGGRQIEEGFTELGTAQHMPQFARELGMAGRPARLPEGMVSPDEKDARAQLFMTLAKAQQELRQRAAIDVTFPAPSALMTRMDQAKADANNHGFVIAALNSADALASLGPQGEAAAGRISAAVKRLQKSQDPVSLEELSAKYASGPVLAMGGWGHYPDFQQKALDWERQIVEVERKVPQRRYGATIRHDDPRITELADEVNRVGAEGKSKALARQIARAMGFELDAGREDVLASGIYTRWAQRDVDAFRAAENMITTWVQQDAADARSARLRAEGRIPPRWAGASARVGAS